MIHPFSHMNSVFAAEQLKAGGGDVTAARRRDFAALLRAQTTRETPVASVAAERQVANQAPAADSVPNPSRQRTAPPAAQPAVPAHVGSPAETPRPRSAAFRRRTGLGEVAQRSLSAGAGRVRRPVVGWSTRSPERNLGPPRLGPRRCSSMRPRRRPRVSRRSFGPKPSSSQSGGAARADWLRNLEHFKGVGIPDGFTEADVELAGAVYDAWGLSRPIFYNGRYGWRAAFVDGNGDSFQASAFTSLAAPHLVVARRQINQIGHGLTPPTIHPFVPPGITDPNSTERPASPV